MISKLEVYQTNNYNFLLLIELTALIVSQINKSLRSLRLCVSLLFVLFILSINYLNAADKTNDIDPSCFSEIGSANIASGNASIAEIGLITSAINNPAAMNCDGWQIYFEAGKRNKAIWVNPYIKFDWDNQLILPSYISVMKSLNNVTVAVGYDNYYSMRSSFEMERTTISQPEGTGEKMEYSKHMDIHNFFVAANYSAIYKIRLGFALGLNYLTHKDDVFKNQAKGNAYGINFILGAIFTPMEKLNFGTTFRFNSAMNYDMKLSGRDMLSQVDVDPLISGNNENINANLIDTFPFEAKFPWSFEIGADYMPVNRLHLSAKIDFQKWETVEDSYKDVTQIHFGSKIRLSQFVKLRFGYFTKYSPFNNTGKYLDQKFITAGIELELVKNITLNFSIMDSRLFENKHAEKDLKDQFHQSYLVTGLSKSF